MAAGTILPGADQRARRPPHHLPPRRRFEQRMDVDLVESLFTLTDVEHGERVRPTPGTVPSASSCSHAVSHPDVVRPLHRWPLDITSGVGYGGVLSIYAPHRTAAPVVDPDE